MTDQYAGAGEAAVPLVTSTQEKGKGRCLGTQRGTPWVSPNPCPVSHLQGHRQLHPPQPLRKMGGKRTTLPTSPSCFSLFLSVLGFPSPPSVPETGEGLPQASLFEDQLCPRCLEWLRYLLPGRLSVLVATAVMFCDGGSACRVSQGLCLERHSPLQPGAPGFTQHQPPTQPESKCLQGASCPPHPSSRSEAPKEKAQEA